MNKKLSVKEILEANEYYRAKNEELNKIYKQTKEMNSLIDLDEVKKALNYKETKDLYEIICYSISDKEVEKELVKIMNNKKIKEYPQILDVHYYPEINEIELLTKEEKIKLDILIKDVSMKPRDKYRISELDNKLINSLCSKGILEKRYSFSCHCNSIECDTEYITEMRKKAFYNYHKFDYESATNEEIAEHEDKFNEGYFEVGCWNDGGYEVCSIEDFENNMGHIDYKVIKEPDMTLDKI